MEIKHWATHYRLPEDDPTFSGLVTDLKALYQVSPPREIPPCLAAGLQQRRPTADGAIPFSSLLRADKLHTRGTRRLLTQGIAATIFIAVLVLASGALTFGVRRATTSRLTIGAGGPASGIPKGAKIKLTIDSYVQSHIVAPQLTSLIHLNDVVSGSIIVERPSDGAIIANANSGMLIKPYTTLHGKNGANSYWKTVLNPSWRPAYRDLTAFGQGAALAPGQTTGISTTEGMVFRQVISATPLQIANAYAALANGGNLMQPHVVQSYNLDGKTTIIQPSVLNKVFLHADTAQRVTNVLVKAGIVGEACEALVPGYDVAAKTGDADRYNSRQTIEYALAYGPVGETDPARRFVVLIELKTSDHAYGSQIAAPAVSEILQQLFQHYGLKPDPKHIQPNQPCSGPDSP